MHFSPKVRRSLSPAPAEAFAVLCELEPAGHISLQESDIVHTPMLLGLLHPVIVLSVGIGKRSTKTLKDILSHELVHAKRIDLAMYIADIPAVFSPQSSYAQIYEFAVVDLDGSKNPEILLQVTDVAGDMGGFMVLSWQNGEVHGYPAHYKTFSLLKTDGTFLYCSLASADNGIGTIRFYETGYTIVPLACSETAKDNQTAIYLSGQKQISEAEYLTAQEQHRAKTDAAWHTITDENIQAVFSIDAGRS